MAEFVTLRERKAAKVAAIKAGVEELSPMLAAYAREHGGRFILYGSAVRGELRYHSDVDIMIDFPVEKELDAWLFAEEQAFSRGLNPDIQTWGFAGERLRDRVAREGRALL